MNQKKAKAIRMEQRLEGIAVSEGQWTAPVTQWSQVTVWGPKLAGTKGFKPGRRQSGLLVRRFQFEAPLPGRMHTGCGRKVYQTVKAAVKAGVYQPASLKDLHSAVFLDEVGL
jgi:hypothetical protein